MQITPQDLFEAGVHLGHQVKRWNPRSKPFIYRNIEGVSIIDLEKTQEQLQKACTFVEDLAAQGKIILFVGTKKAAQEVMTECAISVEMPYFTDRWLGGALTNFETIQKSLVKYKQLLQKESDGELEKMPKKELASLRRKMTRMKKSFDGVKNLTKLPDAIFIVDAFYEQIAVAEGRKKDIPLIGIVDTNTDPTVVDFPIPGNDDSAKSIKILVEAVTEAIRAGKERRESEKPSLRNLYRARPNFEKAEDLQEYSEAPKVEVEAPIVSEPVEPSNPSEK